MECFDFLKYFDKWKPKTKEISGAALEEAVSHSERPEGWKRSKASSKRKLADSAVSQDVFQLLIDQLKQAETSASRVAEVWSEIMQKHMEEVRDIQLMLADLSTIVQRNRRCRLEKKTGRDF